MAEQIRFVELENISGAPLSIHLDETTNVVWGKDGASAVRGVQEKFLDKNSKEFSKHLDRALNGSAPALVARGTISATAAEAGADGVLGTSDDQSPQEDPAPEQAEEVAQEELAEDQTPIISEEQAVAEEDLAAE